jgi:hypothetical protein
MRRLIAILAASAALSPAIASAQTATPQQQVEQHQQTVQQNHQLQNQAAATYQANQTQALNQKTQSDLQNLQTQGGAVSPGAPPPSPLYGSSSAAARGAATANSVPASATVPDVVGGPLNLPGPTDPGVAAYSPGSTAGSVAPRTLPAK